VNNLIISGNLKNIFNLQIQAGYKLRDVDGIGF